jgi:NADH-quinone oxidoreductase subunit N
MIGTSYKWLIVLAILTSAVGVYYYFKVIIAMYFKPAIETEEIPVELSQKAVIILTTLITLALGIVPGFVAEMFSF